MKVKRNNPGGYVQTDAAVTLLTGGGDPHYAFGMAKMFEAAGISVDIIGSDEYMSKAFSELRNARVLNLRGSLNSSVRFRKKIARVAAYYLRLMAYAVSAKPKLFHILWNNKFETIDRTLLMLFYRALGKKVVLTAHNVNAGRRDANNTRFNRFTLRFQYRLAHHIFVHTEKMKAELVNEFHVRSDRATVIPFGINNAVPKTGLTSARAKQKLGIAEDEKAILFFGRIVPYKGLDILVSACQQLFEGDDKYRLIIAGRPDKCPEHWAAIRCKLETSARRKNVFVNASFIPDDEAEVYFKAADVLVLPYREIFQSGVLFLGYSYGLPVLVSDVGSLKDDVVPGETGFVFEPGETQSLVTAIERYFASDLYANLESNRQKIIACAMQQHSWDEVGKAVTDVYASLLPRQIFLDIHTSPHKTAEQQKDLLA